MAEINLLELEVKKRNVISDNYDLKLGETTCTYKINNEKKGSATITIVLNIEEGAKFIRGFDTKNDKVDKNKCGILLGNGTVPPGVPENNILIKNEEAFFNFSPSFINTELALKFRIGGATAVGLGPLADKVGQGGTGNGDTKYFTDNIIP